MRLSVQFVYAQLLFATHVGNNCHLSFKYKSFWERIQYLFMFVGVTS